MAETTSVGSFRRDCIYLSNTFQSLFDGNEVSVFIFPRHPIIDTSFTEQTASHLDDSLSPALLA